MTDTNKVRKKKKATGVWYLLGSLALAIGVSTVMPKVIHTLSNYLFDMMYTPGIQNTESDDIAPLQREKDEEE